MSEANTTSAWDSTIYMAIRFLVISDQKYVPTKKKRLREYADGKSHFSQSNGQNV